MRESASSWGFRIGIIAFLSISALCYFNIKQFVELTSSVDRTNKIIQQVSKIQLMIERIESSQRGYLLSADDLSLSIFQETHKQIEQSIHELEAMFEYDEEQMGRAKKLSALIKERIQKTGLAAKEDTKGLTIQKFSYEIDSQIMKKIRDLAAEIEQIETGFMSERVGKADKQGKWVLSLIIFGGVVALFITLISMEVLRRRAFEQERQANILNSIVNSMGDGLIVTDTSGELIHSNPAAHRILVTDDLVKKPDERAKRLGFHHLSTQQLMKANETPMALALKGQSVDDVEILIKNMRRPNGIIIGSSARPIRSKSGRILGGLTLFRDITKKKSIEEDWQKAREAAVAASKLKSDFLAAMSHEIRTPMNGVIGMTTLLLDSGLTEDQTSYAKTIKSSAESLVTLINGILDHSKIEAGKLTLDKRDFDLELLAKNVQDTFVYMARSKSLSFDLKIQNLDSKYFHADADRLRQILINLIGNAFKFTERGSVTLRISSISSDEKSNQLLFEVIDTGIGMSEESQKKLFQKFSQVHDKEKNKVGGTGLGLSISKELVRLMGGEIAVESKEGFGSKFYFTVNLEKAADAPKTETQNKTSNTKKLSGHILVAEDQVINRTVMKSYLEKCGLESTVVVNGLEALNAYKLNPEKFNLIIIDCQMPIMNGYVATQQIRAFEKQKKLTPIPIIAATAEARSEDKERCLLSGMDDVLIKPIDLNKFNLTLSSWLKRSAIVNDPKVLAKLSEFPSEGSTLDLIMIKNFLDTTPEQIQDLITEYKQNNLERVAEIAHGLKSGCAALGLIMLSELCEQIEDLAENKNDIKDLVKKLPDLLKLTEQALQEYVRLKPRHVA